MKRRADTNRYVLHTYPYKETSLIVEPSPPPRRWRSLPAARATARDARRAARLPPYGWLERLGRAFESEAAEWRRCSRSRDGPDVRST